jgi:hypothetical protein
LPSVEGLASRSDEGATVERYRTPPTPAGGAARALNGRRSFPRIAVPTARPQIERHVARFLLCSGLSAVYFKM